MQNPEACIFDLDGVIVNTAEYHFKAWKRLADELSIPFTKEDNEALKGISRRKSLVKILELDDRRLPEEKFQQLMDKKNGWYQEYISELGPQDILPGVSPFLEEVDAAHIKMAIGSSSKNTRHIMDSIKLNDMFGAVIDGTMIEKTKPDPEVFLKAAQALDVSPSKCLVFEDAAHGVEAAHKGGMKCVGVGSAAYLGEADVVISTFKNLTLKKLLKQLDDTK